MRRWVTALSALAVGVICYVASAFLLKADRAPVGATRINRVSETAQRVIVVLVGANSCRFSTDLTFRRDFARIVAALRSSSERQGKKFVVVGVATDVSVDAGLAFLQKLGPFDEIVAGNGPENVGGDRYIAREFAGPTGTPQILVLDGSPNRSEPHPDTLRMRIVGLDGARRWANLLDPAHSERAY